jgi:hypothetical protein
MFNLYYKLIKITLKICVYKIYFKLKYVHLINITFKFNPMKKKKKLNIVFKQINISCLRHNNCIR